MADDGDVKDTHTLPSRHTIGYFFFLIVLGFLVASGVHYTTFIYEDSQLHLDTVLASLTCDADGRAPLHLPPSYYGIAVWLSEEGLLDAVQEALVTADDRLVASQKAVLQQPLPRMLVHHVQLDPTLRPAEQLLPPPTAAPAAAEAAAENSSTAGAAKQTAAAPKKPFTTGRQAISALGPFVMQQQLGLPTLQHALSLDPHGELELFALSIFYLPGSFFAPSFFTEAAAPHVWCATMQDKHAFCVFTTPLTAANKAAIAAEVNKAVLSVLATSIQVPNFRLDTLAAWHARRHKDACVYTANSVAITKRSLEEHPNIHIPGTVQGTYDRLYHLTVLAAAEARGHDGKPALLPPYVLSAKAADDLQLHPLMTPQLYVPWDHSIVSHVTVLLPLLVCVFLGIRFVLDERKYAKVLLKQAKKTA